MNVFFGKNLHNWSIPFGIIFHPHVFLELSFLCFYVEIEMYKEDDWEDWFDSRNS